MKTFILAAAVSGLALPVLADTVVISTSHANQGVYVSPAEAPDYVRNFDAADVDNNGKLDSGELIHARQNSLFPLTDNEGI